MATININFNTDTVIKERSQAILTDLGLDMSTALNLFLRQLVYREAIPFEIIRPKATVPGYVHNATIESDKELERIRQMRHQFMGSMEGKIWMAEDFDAPIEEMKEYM